MCSAPKIPEAPPIVMPAPVAAIASPAAPPPTPPAPEKSATYLGDTNRSRVSTSASVSSKRPKGVSGLRIVQRSGRADSSALNVPGGY